jgi:hypothetical protein
MDMSKRSSRNWWVISWPHKWPTDMSQMPAGSKLQASLALMLHGCHSEVLHLYF